MRPFQWAWGADRPCPRAVGYSGFPGMVGRPSRWDGSGPIALPVGRKGPRDPTGGLAWVGRPWRLAGTGQETLPAPRRHREALPKDREGSGGPPRGPGAVRRPSRRAGRGQGALLEGW